MVEINISRNKNIFAKVFKSLINLSIQAFSFGFIFSRSNRCREINLHPVGGLNAKRIFSLSYLVEIKHIGPDWSYLNKDIGFE